MQNKMNTVETLEELKRFLRNLRVFVKNGGKPGLGDVIHITNLVDDAYETARGSEVIPKVRKRLEPEVKGRKLVRKRGD